MNITKRKSPIFLQSDVSPASIMAPYYWRVFDTDSIIPVRNPNFVYASKAKLLLGVCPTSIIATAYKVSRRCTNDGAFR